MKILEYNDVNPLQVLHLTMLALDFPFTLEHAAHIRRTRCASQARRSSAATPAGSGRDRSTPLTSAPRAPAIRCT